MTSIFSWFFLGPFPFQEDLIAAIRTHKVVMSRSRSVALWNTQVVMLDGIFTESFCAQKMSTLKLVSSLTEKVRT